MTRWTTLAVLCLTSGCLLGPMQAPNTGIEDVNQQSAFDSTEGMRNLSSTRYAMTDGVWVCPTPEEARAATHCAGGLEYGKNQLVSVIGFEPDGDVWRAEYSDEEGLRHGFIVATSVSDLPDLADLDAYLADLDARNPAETRIPGASINLADMVARAAAYKGLKVVMILPSSGANDREVTDQGMSFTMRVPSSRGSEQLASVQVELRSRAYATRFADWRNTVTCRPAYCDQFVFLARYDGELRDRVDEQGVVRRLPVLQIEELGDRFQVYQAD